MQLCLRRLAPLPGAYVWRGRILRQHAKCQSRAIETTRQGYSTAVEEKNDDKVHDSSAVSDPAKFQDHESIVAVNETDPIFELLLEGYSTAKPPKPPPVALKPVTKEVRAKLKSSAGTKHVRAARSVRRTTRASALPKPRTQHQDRFKELVVAPLRYRLVYHADKAPSKSSTKASLSQGHHRRIRIKHPLAKYTLLGKGGHPSSKVQGAWQTQYDIIIARLKDETVKKQPDLHSEAAAWASRFLNQSWKHAPAQAVRYRETHGNWPDFDWRHSALWLMHVEPERLTEFLDITHDQVHIPALWVADCFQFLASYVSQLQDTAKSAEMALQVKESLKRLSQRSPEDPLVFLGSFARLLMKTLPDAETADLFRMLQKHNIKVHWNTLLHASEFFSEQGDLQTALGFLLEAHDMGGEWRLPHVNIACATLLRSSLQQPQGLELCRKLCAKLQQAGLELNTDIINVLMLGAVDAGELGLANEFFHELFTNSAKPDKYTFVILMRAFLRRPDSAEALDRIAKYVFDDPVARQDPVVGLKLLQCSAELNIHNADQTSWTKIVRMYDHLFDTTPLLQLGFPLPSDLTNEPSFPGARRIEQASIHIMIHAYMTLDSLGHTNIRPLHTIYTRFKALVEGGIEPFVQLATTDATYNSFLRGFASERKTLIHAASVMKDMQTPFSESSPFKKAEPTSRTWTIFMYGFRRNGLTALAEKVLERMQRVGIEPAQDTWNNLAQGYGKEQNEEGFLDTIRRAEQSGAVWTRYMQNGLEKFSNQGRLLRALEKSNMKRALDFSGDLKQGIGARLGAAEADQKEELDVEKSSPINKL